LFPPLSALYLNANAATFGIKMLISAPEDLAMPESGCQTNLDKKPNVRIGVLKGGCKQFALFLSRNDVCPGISLGRKFNGRQSSLKHLPSDQSLTHASERGQDSVCGGFAQATFPTVRLEFLKFK
jgi:hypothetical protein